jgi:hypothetical protein
VSFIQCITGWYSLQYYNGSLSWISTNVTNIYLASIRFVTLQFLCNILYKSHRIPTVLGILPYLKLNLCMKRVPKTISLWSASLAGEIGNWISKLCKLKPGQLQRCMIQPWLPKVVVIQLLIPVFVQLTLTWSLENSGRVGPRWMGHFSWPRFLSSLEVQFSCGGQLNFNRLYLDKT